MRNYKKSILISIKGALILSLALVACTKKFSTINQPWKGSPTATLPELYIGFVSNMALSGGDQNDDNGWIYPITQQGAEYTHPDFAYASTNIWSNFYYNMANYRSYMDLISSRSDSAELTNIKAMLMVLRAYQAIKVSNFYGDLPFTTAGMAIYYGATDYKPAYNTQQSIYLACLTDLQTAINTFNTTDPNQYSMSNSDLVLQNNIPQWIKFANSLRLRIALNMYDKDPTDATPHIADALSKPLLTDYTTDNVGLWPANIPNMDLSARAYTFGTECRLRMGTAMWQWMSSNNDQAGSGIFDPRCKIYFEPNDAGKWNPFPQNPTSSTPAEGGDPYNTNRDNDWSNKNGNNGSVNLYANFNYYWSRDKTIPELFMTAAEVHFLKAEVYSRGIAGITANPATAMVEYNAGIAASMNFWTTMAINSPVWVVSKPAGLPSGAQITAVQTSAVNNFDLADPTHALKQIYAQEWIDMIRQPWDAWTLLKRTGGLTPMDPNNASYYTQTYGNYNRYQYPGSEQTYNYDNWYTETKGQDLITTKIWIAK